MAFEFKLPETFGDAAKLGEQLEADAAVTEVAELPWLFALLRAIEGFADEQANLYMATSGVWVQAVYDLSKTHGDPEGLCHRSGYREVAFQMGEGNTEREQGWVDTAWELRRAVERVRALALQRGATLEQVEKVPVPPQEREKDSC